MSILRNTILASIGALHVTKDKAEKIIDDLIKQGNLDRSDRKKAVMELLAKAEKSTEGIRKKIATEAGKAQKEIKKAVSDLRLSKQSDLKKLETKVDRLARQLKNIEKALKGLS